MNAMKEDHDDNALAGIIIGGGLFYGLVLGIWVVYLAAKWITS